MSFKPSIFDLAKHSVILYIALKYPMHVLLILILSLISRCKIQNVSVLLIYRASHIILDYLQFYTKIEKQYVLHANFYISLIQILKWYIFLIFWLVPNIAI